MKDTQLCSYLPSLNSTHIPSIHNPLIQFSSTTSTIPSHPIHKDCTALPSSFRISSSIGRKKERKEERKMESGHFVEHLLSSRPAWLLLLSAVGFLSFLKFSFLFLNWVFVSSSARPRTSASTAPGPSSPAPPTASARPSPSSSPGGGSTSSSAATLTSSARSPLRFSPRAQSPDQERGHRLRRRPRVRGREAEGGDPWARRRDLDQQRRGQLSLREVLPRAGRGDDEDYQGQRRGDHQGHPRRDPGDGGEEEGRDR
ncbi:very-long-chain 3-oxoacyl-CoA reductase 1-like [Iris pallida]|uniref:Very-long-chain 3-oxoacyl-CoA reductase 1-like n=1 Tax=Iris pallida TaxID=29817 RepID=A0AAX6FRF5_IRIPA|nr:very-long-chain 3-oxoacyl-CoA reductase 1-like [Iris pallida]